MATPIIATIALMQGIAYWNDWTNGLYYITDKNLYSIQQLLNQMISDIKAVQSSDFITVMAGSNVEVPTTAVRMAIAIVAVLPIMVTYPFFQKYFIKGLTLGAVKG
jgi:putative aldouronate transport system permease protein